MTGATIAAADASPAVSPAIPLAGPGGPAAFMSRRADGNMRHVPGEPNRARDAWLASVGLGGRSVLMPALGHTRLVVAPSSPAELEGVEVDGVVTDDPCAALVLTVADCMPIFLFDGGSGAFGLLHSGWKGTGILAEAVGLMARLYGSRPADLRVAFGPRIGPCCYVVDEERAAAFAREFGARAVDRRDGRPRLDLVAANLAIAEGLGLGAPFVADACTSCDEGLGSYRREGPANFTRMAAALGYPEAP